MILAGSSSLLLSSPYLLRWLFGYLALCIIRGPYFVIPWGGASGTCWLQGSVWGLNHWQAWPGAQKHLDPRPAVLSSSLLGHTLLFPFSLCSWDVNLKFKCFMDEFGSLASPASTSYHLYFHSFYL